MGAFRDIFLTARTTDKRTCPSYRNNDLDLSSTDAALPCTAKLLLEGGDARIALGPDGHVNKYGCGPLPDPALLAFGSSTASVISEPAFAAADRLRERLKAATQYEKRESHADVYARELSRTRAKLKSLCGVADMRGLDVVFAASGTDLHLISAQMTSGSEAAHTRVILVGEEETGSCVPAALAGRHFSTRSALGQSVTEGSAIATAAGNAIEVSTVPIRLPNGRPVPSDDIDSMVESLVDEAVALKQRVLLILVDVSKSGLIAPSPACALAIRRRLPDLVEVLVDACQFRIAPPTLRAYLEQGFMVALTGSKFITGPTFAGALLIPAPVSQKMRGRPLPMGLSAYCARGDWPQAWSAADIFDHVANFGLLLRWEASLEELRAFRAVPDAAVADFLRTFSNAIYMRLNSDPAFESLPVPPLDRAAIVSSPNWDGIQTIFPFLLYQPAGDADRTPLNREQTMRVYRLLQADTGDAGDGGVRCQFGQPVACGSQNGMPVSALRICASARLIVEGTMRHGENASTVIDRALVALDNAAILIRSGRYRT